MSWGIQPLLRRWAANTISDRPRLELVSALVIAPLLEEAIFRMAFGRLAAAAGIGRGPAAFGSAALFGLMHVRYGRWFVAYAGVGGLMLWASYTRAGYWAAVLLHLTANLVDLSIGWRRYLYTRGASPGTGEPYELVGR